jgi:hypothetical protein
VVPRRSAWIGGTLVGVSGRSRRKRVLAGLGLAAIALGPSLPPAGPVLMEVVAPAPGAQIGVDGVELLVRFPSDDPLGESPLAETFRALLNGADVTDSLTTGQNGAYGQVSGLLEGENVLRLEIFGRTPWRPGSLFEQAREVRIRMRPPPNLDRG